MDAGFVTSKTRTTIIHIGSHFSLGSTAQPKSFVISQILEDFFSLRDNSANPNIISADFSNYPYFFQTADWGLYGPFSSTIR